jgi:hypothetical protein
VLIKENLKRDIFRKDASILLPSTADNKQLLIRISLNKQKLQDLKYPEADIGRFDRILNTTSGV